MELLVLKQNFEAHDVLDTFESLIWKDRYCGYGDFEIYIKASESALNLLVEDYYLIMEESKHGMIIEGLRITSDVEEGDHLICTGRSFESILDRRIVWEQTVLSGNLQNGIKKLLDENVISPSIPDRAIPNFIFEASDDPSITALTVDAQFTRTNLYATIQKICLANNIGFQVTLSDDNKLVFKLYAGADRSHDQFENPYVVFSPNFENIINSDYAESKSAQKTLTVVAGEGEGDARKTTVVGSGSALTRRELYTDARDLSQTVDGVTLSDEEYLAQLVQRGIEDLSGYILVQSFDGQADTMSIFKYNQDFFMGDIVQLSGGYGIEAKARVTEIIHSQNLSGIEIYPTLTMVDVPHVESDGILNPGSGGPTPIIKPIISGRIGPGGHVYGPVIVKFNDFWVNQRVSYDNATGKFTILESGTYRITMNPFTLTGYGGTRVLIGKNTLLPNPSNNIGHCYKEDVGYDTLCLNTVIDLNAGDYIAFYLSAGALYNTATDLFNSFSIEKISYNS